MEWLIGGASTLTILALLSWRFPARKPRTFGSSQWASPFALFRAGLFRKKGLRVGDRAGRLSVFYDGTHAITFGASGSGKGVSAIVPNLLSYPYVFLIDPGGENTAIAAKFWRARGVPFGCINPFAEFTDDPWKLPAHGFNPLDFLNVHSPSFAADALLFAEMLTPRTGNDGGSTTYFKDAAQTAKRAMIVHIKTAEPRERQSLATLYKYVHGSATEWEKLLRDMKANRACGGLVTHDANDLERIEGQAPEEFCAIMSTIQQDLSFLADPLMRDMLSRSDVNFQILKGLKADQQGGVISVILPLEYMESHAAITRLAMACAVLELQRKPLAKNKVLFLIDECAALGKVLRFPNWLATLRKHRVMIWSIWQNVSQVEALYGKNYQTIVSNCGLLQILGVGKDLETAAYTEKLLGRCTVETLSRNGKGEVSRSQTARPLLMADELRVLKDNQQIVFVGNHHPVRLKKTPYWKRLDLRDRFHANPYYDGKTSGVNQLDMVRDLWGRVYYGLVWFMTPHPIAGCIVTLPLMLYAISLFMHWSG